MDQAQLNRTSLDFSLLSTTLVVLIGYVFCICIYRLYLDPLAKFPGPRLAALTQWVQTYHELAGDGGRFFAVIERWHDQYGPVVRINPFELHIRDESFYDNFYTGNRIAHRHEQESTRFGIPEGVLGTADHAHHRLRKTALTPYFTTRKVAKRCSRIFQLAEKLCDILEMRLQDGSAVDVLDMWGCFASDAVADFCFGKPTAFMASEDFQSTLVQGVYGMVQPVHVFSEFDWLMPMLMRLPDSWQMALNPGVKPVIEYKQEITAQIEATRTRLVGQKAESWDLTSADFEPEDDENLIAMLLRSNLPPAELTNDRLTQECAGLVGAATETVSQTLSLATFHLLDNPDKLSRLCSELKEATSDQHTQIGISDLQKLPYLAACVNEIRRLSVGALARSPRLFPTDLLLPDAAQYSNLPRFVPANTLVSMSAKDVLYSPKIFPDPTAFKPERWLAPDPASEDPAKNVARAPDGRPLTAYLVSFAKGPRNCLGMNFATAEMFVAVATFMRRFGDRLELVEGITRDCVDPYMDRFVVRPRPGAKKLLVRIAA